MKYPEKIEVGQAQKIVDKMKKLSCKTAYKLTLDKERTPALTDTKFGGIPYWDKSREYPVSSNGEKLLLLAQINLSDVQNCNKLPSSGLLQFFIGADDLYGMDFNNLISNDAFRVIYHEVIDESITEEYLKELDIPTNLNQCDVEDFLFPIEGEFAVNVEKTETSVGTADYEYERYMYKAADALKIHIEENQLPFCVIPEEVMDKEYDEARNSGHWLFGYAYFTQFDPRENSTDLEKYILLFQMDSETCGGSGREILWGDSGVGNFFIKPEDLEKLDFSKVMYNWDCC